jgi:hypothetical protein
MMRRAAAIDAGRGEAIGHVGARSHRVSGPRDDGFAPVRFCE